MKNAIGESYFRRRLCFKFHHPLFDGKPFLGEPLKLKESAVQERLEMMKDFDQRVSMEKVVLEFCVHGHNNFLSGFIRVANVTYHKNVFVRYSYDGWSSHRDVKASYTMSYTDCNADQFSFEIPLKQLFTCLEFVICYETDGRGTFWDNNEGKCYTVLVDDVTALDTSTQDDSRNQLLVGVNDRMHQYEEECNRLSNVSAIRKTRKIEGDRDTLLYSE